jgi:hypothetical protein
MIVTRQYSSMFNGWLVSQLQVAKQNVSNASGNLRIRKSNPYIAIDAAAKLRRLSVHKFALWTQSKFFDNLCMWRKSCFRVLSRETRDLLDCRAPRDMSSLMEIGGGWRV